MTPIRSSTLNAGSDLLAQNQTSNGVYPVRPQKIATNHCMVDNSYNFTGVEQTAEFSGGLTG